MDKHRLDQATEDILQHYGIKGMSWGNRRSEEELAAARDSESAGGGAGEVDESLVEELGDFVGNIFDSLDQSLDKVGDSLKKTGMSLLTNIFGKSKATANLLKPGGKQVGDMKRNTKLENAMKTYDKASPAEKSLMKKGYSSKVSSNIKDSSSSGSSKALSVKGFSGRAVSDKEADKVISEYKKRGFKKLEKSKKSLAERGYSFKTDSKK